MKRTLLAIFLTAIVFGGGAYAVGRTAGGSSPDSAAAEHAHQESQTDTHREVIAGAGHVHAVTHRPDGTLLLGAHGGLFRSSDGGANWTSVDVVTDGSSSDFMSLVPSPSAGDELLAGGHGLGVVRSSDGGATWTRADSGIEGTDIHGLAVNQRDPDYLYAYSVGKGVYRSMDAGQSWDRVDDGPSNPAVRSLAYMAVQTDMDLSMDSENWGMLFAGTADGVEDSYSCFCGWRHSSDDLAGSTIYTLATNHDEARTMYAGATDGVWKTTDEGESWERLDGIDGRIAAISIDPADLDDVVAVTELGAVYRTTDAGDTWNRQN